ncbi:MAG TPA: 3-phosphoshikimate 1-carboxyvinyltransferase [Casimicrobiaceae bacterium]|nr:3-phosphoshikimate 1-carboxyvinyltransferase [Casimicrobiaceae bacterium]
MSATLALAPARSAAGTVALPGSKSITNRALLLAALAQGTTRLHDVLDADDTRVMIAALRALGVDVAPGDAMRTLTVSGRPDLGAIDTNLQLGNAGTAFRPLTAVLAMARGHHVLDGVARMRERPIGDLVDALRELGASIDYRGVEGYPPLAIAPLDAREADQVRVRGDVSSQFLSALLLALPRHPIVLRQAMRVAVTTPLISRPYVEITTRLMQRFGVEVATPDAATFVVPRGARYASPGRLDVEGDASSASYFLAAGVLGGGPVRVEGVGRASIQGDVAFAGTLAQLGADIRFEAGAIEARRGRPLDGGTLDCTAIPDAAMTLAMTALFATASTTLSGIGSWRVKETDRIAAMATELAKLGAGVEAGADWLRVTPPAVWTPATIDTYDDHRMAMCFALAAFGGAGVTIRDPDCVAKTFPDFFARFASLVQ